MKSLSPQTLWCAALAVGMAILGPSAWVWAQAARSESAQTQRLARIAGDARTLGELRANLPEWTLLPKSTATLAPQVSATLSAAGLPASSMASLSADNTQAVSASGGATGVQIRGRRATLALSSVTLPQLGAFLQAWRERQPGWVVSAVDVAPENATVPAKGRDIAQTGGDLPLRAVLTLETLSLERGGVR